jgi:hypothetical protein
MTELFHEIEFFSIHFWSEEVILKSEYDEKINICDERKGKKIKNRFRMPALVWKRGV